MKLPLADLLDRYSIELRKDFYGHGNPELVKELGLQILEHLTSRSMNHLPADVFSMIQGAVALGLANADIANLEWQMRVGDFLSLEEMGLRAKTIRHINDNGRVKARQQLSASLGENVETRHYGYGDLDPKKLSLKVQDPAHRDEAVPVLPDSHTYHHEGTHLQEDAGLDH